MNTKNTPNDDVDGQPACPSRRLFLENAGKGALLAALCLFVGCERKETKKKVDRVLPHEDEQVSDFDFREFSPIADGSIVYSDFKNDSAKTVVFFSDFHPESSDDPTVLEKFGRTQSFIFDNVSALLDEYGTVDIVQENSATDTVTRNALLGVTSGHMAEMGALARITNKKRRIDIARGMVGKDPSRVVSICLTAVYDSDELNFIPVYSPRELDAVMQEHSRLSSFVALSKTPELIPCPDGRMDFSQVRARLENGDMSLEVLDCFCMIHHVEGDLIKDFFHNRWVDAPRKEVDAASKATGKFSVVVAGSLHLNEAIRYASEKGLNCMVVAPKEMADDVLHNIHTPIEIDHVVARDPGGVCDQFRAEYERWKRSSSVR